MATSDEDDLSVKAILETLETAHAAEEPVAAVGLRELKKRRLRQRISNVATALFLADGFDNVSTARIAAASEVSEQTVFNYFPTKESMFYDRSESFAEAIADAVRHRGDKPLEEVLLDAMIGGVPVGLWPGVDEARAMRLFRRFCEVAESSPVLRAAPFAEAEHFTATVGASLAERVGCEPNDPEVGLAAFVIAGLGRVSARSAFFHVQRVPSMDALGRAVRADVIRALKIAAPALEAFDNVDRQSGRRNRR
jgi:AcrR family transcriptional regulator